MQPINIISFKILENFVSWYVSFRNFPSVGIFIDNPHVTIYRCGRWLADDEDDKAIVRELPAEGPDIKKPQPGMYKICRISDKIWFHI